MIDTPGWRATLSPEEHAALSDAYAREIADRLTLYLPEGLHLAAPTPPPVCTGPLRSALDEALAVTLYGLTDEKS